MGPTPEQKWKNNPDRIYRSVDDAVAIARANGVDVPDDVEFFVDEWNTLDQRTTARGPKVTKPPGGIVIW